jgi:hypothetical protein
VFVCGRGRSRADRLDVAGRSPRLRRRLDEPAKNDFVENSILEADTREGRVVLDLLNLSY